METISKRLVLEFNGGGSDPITISVVNPHPDITSIQVSMLKDEIEANPIFGSGDALAFEKAYYKTRLRDVLDI